MLDTPEEMLQMQRQIILKMSPEKRFQLGIQMINDIKKLAENSLKLEHPKATQAELKRLLFRRYYGQDLPIKDLEACSSQLLTYWQKKEVPFGLP